MNDTSLVVLPPAKRHPVRWLLSNGPPVVTVLGSAAVAILASVVTFSQVQFFQAILALLALIGTSLVTEKLGDTKVLRERLGSIEARLEAVLTYARDVEAAGLDRLLISRRDLSPLETRLEGARRLAISGGSLFRIVNEYKKLLEQLAADGCQMRFMMTDPESAAAEFLSTAISYESNSVEAYRGHMRDALIGLLTLAQQHPATCHVRVCSFAPPFSLLSVGRDSDHSTMQVELYPFNVPTRDRPLFALNDRRDPRLFSLFAAQFEAQWSSPFTREVALPKGPAAAREA